MTVEVTCLSAQLIAALTDSPFLPLSCSQRLALSLAISLTFFFLISLLWTFAN